jgi:hypothetical protein
VFPCEPRGKRPLTRNGLLDASTDPEIIKRSWRDAGLANVAIRTGRASGLVVLDVDGLDGMDSLRDLEAEHGELPRTASVRTPRGGRHFYFQYPGDGEVRNSVGRLGVALDIRGDGGYVLAPPSLGPLAGRYEPDGRRSVAPLPMWLLKRITGQQALGDGRRPATPVSEWVAIVRDGLPEGQRNDGLARLVGHLLERDVDARLVRELAHAVAQQFRPPLAGAEVDRVVESISSRELRSRRSGAR